MPELPERATLGSPSHSIAERHYLITGAAGFIGSSLTDLILARGGHVTGIDCFDPYYPRAIKQRNLQLAMNCPRFRLLQSDLLQADLELARLCRGVDAVFHLAARPGVRSSWGQGFESYLQANVLATQRILEALPKDVPLVFASSSSVYGDISGPASEDVPLRPLSPYGVTKVAMEALVAAYARQRPIRALGLRYFTVYGPKQRPDMAISRFITRLFKNQPITVYGDGTQHRDMTFVTDVVEATLRAASVSELGLRIMNVGTGTTHELNEIIDMLGQIMGVEVGIRYVDRQAGDVLATHADTAALSRLIGTVPATPLVSGLTAQVEAMRTAHDFVGEG